MHKEIVFSCREWAALSPHAKNLYWLMKGKRNPKKYGNEVRLSYRELKRYGYTGLKRQATIRKAFKELCDAGWIKRKAEGGGLYGRATIYILTGRFDQYGF
jgi:hypothetical protein